MVPTRNNKLFYSMICLGGWQGNLYVPLKDHMFFYWCLQWQSWFFCLFLVPHKSVMEMNPYATIYWRAVWKVWLLWKADILRLELDPSLRIDIHACWLIMYWELCWQRNVGVKRKKEATHEKFLKRKERDQMQAHEGDRGKGGHEMFLQDRVFSSGLEIGSDCVVLSGVGRSSHHWEHRK